MRPRFSSDHVGGRISQAAISVCDLISVDRWILQNAHKSLHFLTHCHTDHMQNLTAAWRQPIYCSPVTAKLLPLLCPVDPCLIRPLALDETHELADNCGSGKTFNVKLIEAHHCPGSVMLLFDGWFGRVLHTGDVRLDDSLKLESALGMIGSDYWLDKVIVDNTYWLSTPPALPSRVAAAGRIITIILENPAHQIFIAMRNLGKEDLLIKIAEETNEKILVSRLKWNILKCLEAPRYFSLDEAECRISVTGFPGFRKFNCHKSCDGPVILIVPTGLDKLAGGNSRPAVPDHLAKAGCQIHVVPYSDHCSRLELEAFLGGLRYKKVVPLSRKMDAMLSLREFQRKNEDSAFNAIWKSKFTEPVSVAACCSPEEDESTDDEVVGEISIEKVGLRCQRDKPWDQKLGNVSKKKSFSKTFTGRPKLGHRRLSAAVFRDLMEDHSLSDDAIGGPSCSTVEHPKMDNLSNSRPPSGAEPLLESQIPPLIDLMVDSSQGRANNSGDQFLESENLAEVEVGSVDLLDDGASGGRGNQSGIWNPMGSSSGSCANMRGCEMNNPAGELIPDLAEGVGCVDVGCSVTNTLTIVGAVLQPPEPPQSVTSKEKRNDEKLDCSENSGGVVMDGTNVVVSKRSKRFSRRRKRIERRRELLVVGPNLETNEDSVFDDQACSNRRQHRNTGGCNDIRTICYDESNYCKNTVDGGIITESETPGKKCKPSSAATGSDDRNGTTKVNFSTFSQPEGTDSTVPNDSGQLFNLLQELRADADFTVSEPQACGRQLDHEESILLGNESVKSLQGVGLQVHYIDHGDSGLLLEPEPSVSSITFLLTDRNVDALSSTNVDLLDLSPPGDVISDAKNVQNNDISSVNDVESRHCNDAETSHLRKDCDDADLDGTTVFYMNGERNMSWHGVNKGVIVENRSDNLSSPIKDCYFGKCRGQNVMNSNDRFVPLNWIEAMRKTLTELQVL